MKNCPSHKWVVCFGLKLRLKIKKEKLVLCLKPSCRLRNASSFWHVCKSLPELRDWYSSLVIRAVTPGLWATKYFGDYLSRWWSSVSEVELLRDRCEEELEWGGRNKNNNSNFQEDAHKALYVLQPSLLTCLLTDSFFMCCYSPDCLLCIGSIGKLVAVFRRKSLFSTLGCYWECFNRNIPATHSEISGCCLAVLLSSALSTWVLPKPSQAASHQEILTNQHRSFGKLT